MSDGDHELVQRLQGGDSAAFDLLYHRHKARLYRHALLQTGGRPAIAEEVVQDVFMALFEGKARPERSVAGYLLTAVRRRAINACSRRESRGDQVPFEAVGALVAQADGPAEAVGTREEAALLGEALLQLTPEQREVVLLRTFEGLAWREVAELAGVALPTAFSRYRAALNALRKRCGSLSHA